MRMSHTNFLKLECGHGVQLYERLKEKVDSPEFLAKLMGDGTEGIRSPERTVVNIAGTSIPPHSCRW